MTTTATSDIPRYAVVGRVNKGKSSILSTLIEEDDNAKIRVGPTPGETTRAYGIPLTLNGETLIEFIDTPGFNRARQALDWMNRHHQEGSEKARIETVRRFVEAHADDPDFQDECRLLQPILGGAGILYVVDSSKPYRADFKAEMEILRWTGQPRMAVMNNISDETDYAEEWRRHLQETFNLTREFNAHNARFRERVRLLRNLLEIEEAAKGKIEKIIDAIEAEWTHRRSEAADLIIDLLSESLKWQTCRRVSNDEVERDHRRRKVEEDLKAKYCEDIKKLEAKHHQKLEELYRHRHLERAAEESDALVEGDDLFAEETWQVLGLNRNQLALAGAIAGGGAGLTFDVATGGLSHGVATIVGAASGYAAALWKGRALAEIKISNPLGIPADASAGGVKLCAGPPRNPNFPWILLDRVLYHYYHLLTRAHGRRDPFMVDFSRLGKGDRRSGYSTRFETGRRRALQKWFSALSGKKDAAGQDAEVFDHLTAILAEIEDGKLTIDLLPACGGSSEPSGS